MNAPKSNPKLDDKVGVNAEANRIWMVTKMGVLGLYRSQLPRMAAALAYRTIFSIIPVMAIGLLIFGSLVSDQQVESGVRRVLSFAGISQISAVETPEVELELDSSKDQTEIDPSRIDIEIPDLDEVVSETGSEAERVISDLDGSDIEHVDDEIETERALDDEIPSSNPFANADIEQVITDLINRVNQSIRNVPTGWIALTSGLVLLYAAMSMLIEIEKAFNQLCGAPSGRGWLRRLMLYWTILTAGSLLLSATFLAGDAFTRWVVVIAGQDSMVGAMMAGYGVSVLISTLLLLGAYLTIPNIRIQFRSALAGAFFAAIIWELGKLGFTTYLRYTTGYAKFYGSVAILPLFMMWVYLTWLIVLFGMQASFALQNFSRLVESKLALLSGQIEHRPILNDPMVMIGILRSVYERFEEGSACTLEEIAGLTKLESAQARELLEVLEGASFVNRVFEGEEHVGWGPARPADQVMIKDVLQVAYTIDGYRSSGMHAQLPDEFVGKMIGLCEGVSVKSLFQSDEEGEASS